MVRPCWSAVLTVLCFALLITQGHSYDFGGCPELADPVGIHPSTKIEVQAGRLEVVKSEGEVVVTALCDDSSGWILADSRFQHVRCSYNEKRQVWTWSHQHLSQATPPQIRCSSFSPRPLEQTYTLHNYQGCSSPDTTSSLTSQVSSQLATALPCQVDHKCEVLSVRCWRMEGSSKLAILVEATMLAGLGEQIEMLSEAARFLRDDFKPVFNSGGVTKRDVGSPFDDTDPDNSTSADCTDGQKTVIDNTDGTSSDKCVDCTAGYYANKTDPNNETCEPCPLDTYSVNNTNAQCTDCPGNEGTLAPGSDSEDSCTAVCTVPSVDFTSSMYPPAGERVLEGGSVTINCDTNFYYGNQATASVVCNSTINTFPSSCRSVQVSTHTTSIKDGTNVFLNCSVTATGTLPQLSWYRRNPTNSTFEKLSADGKTYSILQFEEKNIGDYKCKLDYQDPILDDMSQPLSLNVLDLQMKPHYQTMAFAGDSLNLTCKIRINQDYPNRVIVWSRGNMKTTINTGISTSEDDHFFESVLFLHPLEVEDTDLYTCQATYSSLNNADKINLSKDVDVVVRGFLEEPEDVTVLIGKEFVLSCEFFVGPGVSEDNAIFTWQHELRNNSWTNINETDSHAVTGTFNNDSSIYSTSLKVAGTKPSDGGRYRCVNYYFGDRYMTYSVATVTTYDLGIETDPVSSAYLVGETAELSCKVALPENNTDTVSVSWAKQSYWSGGETDVPDDMTFFNGTSGISTLTLNSVSMSDVAKYLCRATYHVDGKTFLKDSLKAKLFVREISEKLEKYSLFNIPFYYDDEGNMYDDNRNNSVNNTDDNSGSDDKDDSVPDHYTFFCEYMGDDNIGNVTWSVQDENGTDVDFMDNKDTEYKKGGFYAINETSFLNTTLKLGRKFVTKNYNASLGCHFHPADNIGDTLSSTTKFIVHAIRPLESTVTSNETVNITCSYVGTDDPDTVTWYVDDTPLGAGDDTDMDNYAILPVSYDRKLRSDVLVVSSRRYSDPDKNITCVYSFSQPDATLKSNTTLIYRGFHSKLRPEYYLAKDHGKVEMQCQLGVGGSSLVPDRTVWYSKDSDISLIQDYLPGLFNISTDKSPINGLFTTKLTITDAFISSFLAGSVSCSFTFGDEVYTSKTTLHTRISYNLPDMTDLYGFSPNTFPLGCYLDSDEAPVNITWTGPSESVISNAINENRTINTGNSTIIVYFLNLTLPTSEDSGAYTCKFNFEKGPSVKSTFPNVEFSDIEITNPARVYATASGVNVRLECQVESHEALYELGWFDVDEMDWITPSNITYDNVSTVATYDLQVNSKDDRGNFTCVLDEEQYSKKNVSVIVLDLHPSFSGVVVADEGDTVSLSCALDYNSDLTEPTIEWYEDDVQFHGGSVDSFLSAEGDMWVSELSLRVDVSVTNKKYHCVGKYSGISASSPLVSDKVTILMTSMVAEREYVMAAEGDDREFLCTAYSKDPVSIFWRKTVEGVEQNITGDSYPVKNTPEFVSQSILKLRNLAESDTSNSIECWFMPGNGGEKFDTITLDVIELRTIGREVTRGLSAELTCSATPQQSRIEDLRFKWYRIDELGREEEKNETRFETGKSMLKISSANDTSFTCLVFSDPFGIASNATRSLSYKVFDITSPRDVTVTAGDNVTLTCKVTENTGTPHFSWYKESDNTNVLFESSGSSNGSTSEYTFKTDSFELTGNYFCNVSIYYDGETNGPFKSNTSCVIVREFQSSFKNLTLVHEHEGRRKIQELECVYRGDLPAVDFVEWRTPSGRFSEGDYAEFIQVNNNKSDENTYKTVLTYSRTVKSNEEFFCDFHMKNGDVMSKYTRVSVFNYTELPKYTYNPTEISFTYVSEVSSNVTWLINNEVYDSVKHTAFTPGHHVIEPRSSIKFNLTVDMSKLDEGADPVEVKGIIKFDIEENEGIVTQPYPDKQVNTIVYKRDFVEELESYLPVPQNVTDKTFTCLVAGDSNNVSFSWFIGSIELLEETENIEITQEADPVGSDKRLKSTLTVRDITKSPLYNNELKCKATWEDPEMFSVESVADLDTYGASIEPRSNTKADGSAVLTCLVWGNDPPKSVFWMDKSGNVVEKDENRIEIKNETVKTGQNDLHVHTLTFTSLKSGNEGQYTCSVIFQDDIKTDLETQVYFIGASFTTDSPRFVHDLDEEVKFTCVYRGFREPSNVTWYMTTEGESKKPVNTSSSNFDVDTRQFNDASNTQESTLMINNVDVSASGNYECVWETDSLDVTATMVLAVRMLKAKEDVFYSTEGAIYLECQYKGTEEGTMTWFYKSQPLNDEDESITMETGEFDDTSNLQTFKLQISEVSLKENSGVYTCSLSFPDGDVVTGTTRVVVRESVILSDYSWTTDDDVTTPLVYAEDGVSKMQCQLDADKVPSDVEWSFNGNKIQFDGVRKIMVNSVLSGTTGGLRYFSNVTLKGDENVVDGRYTCKFTFFDKQTSGQERTISTSTHVTILKVDVAANKKCTFVDYQKERDASLGCTFEGDIEPVNVGLRTSIMYLPNGKARSLDVSESLQYSVVNVTNKDDGVYKCTFETDSKGASGYPIFSASQRLISRKAMISSSSTKVLAGFTMTLSCNIPGGAKSISWFEDGAEILEYRTIDENTVQTNNGLIEQMSVSLKVKHSGSFNETLKNYTCKGKIYDQFCPDVHEFESAPVTVDVIPAQPIDGPGKYGETSYEGDSYEFTCKFPNPMNDRSYNVYWKYNNKRILNNGDLYDKSGNRIIDGEIYTFDDNSEEFGIPIIETRFKILAVNPKTWGEYQCGVTWRNGVMIKSEEAFLYVRHISLPPRITNAVSGSTVTLRCTAQGNGAAQISFYKITNSDGRNITISGATQTDDSSGGLDDTVSEGQVVVQTADSDFDYFYCNATWGNRSLVSERVYFNVFETCTNDETEAWGVLGSVIKIECLSDAALKDSEHGTQYQDEYGRVVYADASVGWLYKGQNDTDFKPIDDEIRYSLESPWIGFDGQRRRAITIGPLESSYLNNEFVCSVDYTDSDRYNFFGGEIRSSPTTLKISNIKSFTTDYNEVIEGQTFNLTCTAEGETKPEFTVSNDMRSLDKSRYTIITESIESKSNSTVHVAKYQIQSNFATVIQGGQDFYCSVDFGSNSPERMEKLKITTYYNCSNAKISVLGKAPANQTIDYEDGQDGNRTATVTCPADTNNTRYSIYESTQAKGKAVCKKDKGYYEPSYLAICLASRAFENGRFEQIWNLKATTDTYCTDSSTGEYSKTEMTETLTTKNSKCGPYPIVPCLKESECTLDVEKTGCRWDESDSANKRLHVFYQVNFNKPVWTIQERKNLAHPDPGTKIKFWDCPETLQNPGRRTASKRGRLLDRMAVDQDSDMVVLADEVKGKGKNYNALGIGIAGVVAAAIFIAALLYKRSSKRTPDMTIGTGEFEMTDRSMVVRNHYTT
ncbi:hypothetical protein ACHWQZ_G004291 [Mnemiopsis leidyi]